MADRVAEPRRMLVVCTANLCRSPVGEALLARRLAGVVDIDGRSWTVRSAGTDQFRLPVDPDTVAAAAAMGLDITEHTSRQVRQGDLDEADLVLTMTRSHLRSIVAIDQSVWPRTFTMKELVRRARGVAPDDDGFAGWLGAARTGRRAADMLSPSDEDDVGDPFHCGRAANLKMVAELDRLTAELLIWGPWLPPKQPE